MDDEQRQAVWLESLGAAVLAAWQAAHRPQLPGVIEQGAIQELRAGAHRAMDEANTEAERDAMYERHRALSAILQSLRGPEEPGV